MGRCRKWITGLMACLIALQPLTLPAFAEEITVEEEIFEIIEEAFIPEETLAEEILQEETEEDIPEEDMEAEDLPEEDMEEEVFLEEPAEELVPEEEEPKTDSVPLYFQTDYPDVHYGEGSVATSGCSITTLAMAATYLTGHEYLPDELARYFANEGDNNMERLEYASEMLQLPYKKNWDWRVTYQALEEGKIAIVLVNSDSPFTQSQHFILLTGLTEEGRILVHDPYEPNYGNWELQQGFENGFDESTVICGFEGAWVYDPGAIPEDPFIYEEALPDWESYGPVPLYFQTDYPNTAYADGTVATSGCSITTLAMVASYMTGHEYLPDELARYFGGAAENHIARLEYGSEMLQLPYEKNWDWHVTRQALREGKIAIVLMNADSAFTQSQHFILLTGLTPEGRVMVHDPFEPNYENWELEQGFENGFPEAEIICGFEGAWVYDRSAMPEEPVIYCEEVPETVDYGPVPLYFQNDYPNVRYAGGTVATSGCSVTTLAMVASYMTGHEYLPDDLARYFGGRAENHIARLEYGSEVLQIPYEKNWDWNVTRQALREGKIAIVLVNSNSQFTQTQHFIILTGLTPDGKILVNDSWEPNYSHWALKEGFVSGFEPEQILCGFEGAWVYDKGAMPETPVEYYYEPLPERGASRYTGVELTLEEEDLLAKVIWAEARGESPEGQQAVAEVVLNRLVSEQFPDTLDDVIYGEEQFRSVPHLKDAEPSQAQYDALEAALYGPNILPMDVYYFATWETNDNVWGQIGDHIFCRAE